MPKVFCDKFSDESVKKTKCLEKGDFSHYWSFLLRFINLNLNRWFQYISNKAVYSGVWMHIFALIIWPLKIRDVSEIDALTLHLRAVQEVPFMGDVPCHSGNQTNIHCFPCNLRMNFSLPPWQNVWLAPSASTEISYYAAYSGFV